MAEMKYVEIPYVNKKVSRIFYGTATEPFMMGGDGNELLDAIYATGVNAFDTARKWYEANQMPVIAYSSLGRGLFSGRVKGDEPEKAAEILDAVAMKGYASPDNFERLRRCERLAEEKNCSVSQIAMAWVYNQRMNTFAVVSTSNPKRMQQNIDALSIELTDSEMQYLDLEREEK